MVIRVTMSPEGARKFQEFLQGRVGKGLCGYCSRELSSPGHNLDIKRSDCCPEYVKHFNRELLARRAGRLIARWKHRGRVGIMGLLKEMMDISCLYNELTAEIEMLWSNVNPHNVYLAKRFERIRKKVEAEFTRRDKPQQTWGGAPFNIRTGKQEGW
jgi:hypothetical protein